jgi:hypothetical protein
MLHSRQHRSLTCSLTGAKSSYACLSRCLPPCRLAHVARTPSAAPDSPSYVSSSSSSSPAAAALAGSSSSCLLRPVARQHGRGHVSVAAAAAEVSAPPPEAAYRPPEPHKLVMTVAGQQVRSCPCFHKHNVQQTVAVHTDMRATADSCIRSSACCHCRLFVLHNSLH